MKGQSVSQRGDDRMNEPVGCYKVIRVASRRILPVERNHSDLRQDRWADFPDSTVIKRYGIRDSKEKGGSGHEQEDICEGLGVSSPSA